MATVAHELSLYVLRIIADAIDRQTSHKRILDASMPYTNTNIYARVFVSVSESVRVYLFCYFFSLSPVNIALIKTKINSK